MRLLFIILFTFSIDSFANHYAGASFFTVSPQASSNDDFVNDFTNSGAGYGVHYGYLFKSYAPEFSYKYYKIEGNDDQLSVTNKYLNVGFRLFLGYFNFKLGFALNDSRGETNSGDEKYRSTNTTLSYGFGLRYQFEQFGKKWDVFSDLNIHSIEDSKDAQSKFIMREFEFGLRYYF